MYGIKDPRFVTKDEVREMSKKLKMISKYEQPLQLLYFDETGTLISFHNNCYTGGFPKLKWNKNHQFEEFVPKTTIPITDSALRLSLLISYIEPIDTNYRFANDKIIIVLFWSGFMMKQSKELIETARQNLKLDITQSAKILYVNTDNCFVGEKYTN